MKKLLAKLPKKYRWSLHNLVAHPLSEILWQVGFKKLSDKVHDSTVPDDGDVGS